MKKNINNDFSEHSEEYVKKTDIKHRKEYGQYFTPEKMIQETLSHLPNKKNVEIWEPSAGSGDFVEAIRRKFKSSKIVASEIDKNLVGILKKRFDNDKNITISHHDSLEEENKEKYDFVIGNPPYFEITLSEKQNKDFGDVVSGRANIYAMFIKKGIESLKENGYLAFVVPPSMNNGAYFKKLREYIVKNTNIECLKIVNGSDFFDGANQTVMIIVLKKVKNNGDYIFSFGDDVIFSEDYLFLRESSKKGKTLAKLNFRVKTGQVIWNENKDRLTKEKTKNSVFLIWSHNIKDGKITQAKENRPQYIKKTKGMPILYGPAIVVNRIVGKVGGGKLRSAFIPKGFEFVAENHVNVITPLEQDIFSEEISEDMIKKVSEELSSERVSKIIRSMIGNTQVSKNELENMIPIIL